MCPTNINQAHASNIDRSDIFDIFLKSLINKIIDGISARSGNIQSKKKAEIYKSEFSLREKGIVDIEKCNRHGNDHRNHRDTH